MRPDTQGRSAEAVDESASPEGRYIRAAEAAELLRVSPKTISRWAKEGRLPHMVTLGGHRRFPAAVIETLARELEVP